MAEQTLQDVQPQVPDQPVAQVSEAQVQPQSLPEPIPAQPPPEEQSHQTEAQPEPITIQADTLMSEAAPSPIPQQQRQSSTMPRHSTPSQNFNGVAETLTIPSKAASHGAPARRYLNEKVTGVLVEGLKRLVTLKPDEPIRWLGEYLIKRSKDIEGP